MSTSIGFVNNICRFNQIGSKLRILWVPVLYLQPVFHNFDQVSSWLGWPFTLKRFGGAIFHHISSVSLGFHQIVDRSGLSSLF